MPLPLKISIGLEIIFILCVLWFWVCNHKANRKRLALIHYWEGPYFDEFLTEYNRVSYDRHLWALVTFRDPKALYGEIIQYSWENCDNAD